MYEHWLCLFYPRSSEHEWNHTAGDSGKPPSFPLICHQWGQKGRTALLAVVNRLMSSSGSPALLILWQYKWCANIYNTHTNTSTNTRHAYRKRWCTLRIKKNQFTLSHNFIWIKMIRHVTCFQSRRSFRVKSKLYDMQLVVAVCVGDLPTCLPQPFSQSDIKLPLTY